MPEPIQFSDFPLKNWMYYISLKALKKKNLFKWRMLETLKLLNLLPQLLLMEKLLQIVGKVWDI